ncbi:MAG: hypothetical protein NZ555_15480 [Geminicoccaceae bacterium]|nr:hypothetical protein [Geminicoccaceae bacterium]MCX8101785.1 hypothetical protein [Geminicoccaceae bacterium]MDW8369980.1 Fic/DOC family N-terminal domain-containing protein [Geminicoccaceae bacterium]
MYRSARSHDLPLGDDTLVPTMALTGRWVPTVAGIRAFVPDPLPPKVDLAPVQLLLDETAHLLGELNGAGRRMINPHLFVRPLANREAIATSRMEGSPRSTNSSDRRPTRGPIGTNFARSATAFRHSKALAKI